MLPFLAKPKKQVDGAIIEHRIPDKEPLAHEEGLDACSKDIIDAINSNDIKKLSKAIMAAFQIADAMPHEEGEHPDESQE